jgi:invasion protein IalB
MFRLGLAVASLLSFSGLASFGQAYAADTPIAPNVAVQAFSNWLYRCQHSPDGTQAAQACEVVQEMVVQQDGKSIPVLTMAFARADSASKNHLITILAPLGVQLKPGLGIAADDGKQTILDFQYCDQRGCWIAGLTINFSLSGLGAGIGALDSGKPPVQAAQSLPPPSTKTGVENSKTD